MFYYEYSVSMFYCEIASVCFTMNIASVVFYYEYSVSSACAWHKSELHIIYTRCFSLPLLIPFLQNF